MTATGKRTPAVTPPLIAEIFDPPQTPAAAGPRKPAAAGPSPAVASVSQAAAEQTPARGVRSADSAPLAGPENLSEERSGRRFVIELPAGLPLLSLNDRDHWTARKRRSDELKKAAWAMALKLKLPALERVSVLAEYQPPDLRRRDSDNPVASVKACIDGIVSAGILPDDASPRYVESVTCRIGEPYPRGRLVLVLTEVPAAGEGSPGREAWGGTVAAHRTAQGLAAAPRRRAGAA